MEFTGRYRIAAPPQAVWDGLNDPAILKACIPGCERLDRTGPEEFQARATLKIGPMKATFQGKVTLTEMEPPLRCVLRGEGQGGVAGFAKGESEVVLTPDGEDTVLSYTARAMVGGKLAQMGQRLMDGTVKQIADDFFARFQAILTQNNAPSLEPDPYVEIEARTAAAQEAVGRDGMTPEIWVVGLIGVVVIILVLFGVVL